MSDFEKPIPQETPYVESGMSPDDILDQLEVSEERYTDALSKLREGNLNDLDYLREMKKNLIAFQNAFSVKFGVLHEKNKEIYNRTSTRLAELNSALEEAGV